MRKNDTVDWPQKAVDQVRATASQWNSDKARLSTVIDELRKEGCKNAAWLINEMLRRGMLYMPQPGFLAVVPVPQRSRSQ